MELEPANKYKMKLIILFIGLLIFFEQYEILGQSVPDVNHIVKQYQENLSTLKEKGRKIYLKHLKKESGYGFSYSQIDKKSLDYTIIPVYKLKLSYKDTSDYNNIFKNLRIKKKKRPLVFVSKNGSYFGNFFDEPNSTFPPQSEILLDHNSELHEAPMKSYNAIVEFNPDATFYIAHSRMNITLIKDNEIYFLGYFDHDDEVIVPLDEWMQDFRVKHNTHWSELFDEQIFN